MPARKRKRCGFCRCLYLPDGRSAWRQWACSKPECQEKRRAATQRRYREKNPGDRAGRQYRAAVSAAKAGEAVAGVPPRTGPLVVLPWDEMRDEFSPEVIVFIALFGRLLIAAAKDEMRAQLVDLNGKIGRLPRLATEDEMEQPRPPP